MYHLNFDFARRQIHCGSRKVGTYIHDIRTDSEYKNLLCGYICIEYSINLTTSNDIITVTPNSFIVLPKISTQSNMDMDIDMDIDMDTTTITTKLFNDKTSTGLFEKFNTCGYGFVCESFPNSSEDRDHDHDHYYYWYTSTDPSVRDIKFSSINNYIIKLTKPNYNLLFEVNNKFIVSEYDMIQRKLKSMPNPNEFYIQKIEKITE